MKNLLWVGTLTLLLAIVSLLSASSSAGQERNTDKLAHNPFVGAWRLAWLEEQDADGKVHRADCTGLLVYTLDGYMSVQVMYQNPQPSPASGPVQYAQNGYEASFGEYEIDEASHTFTYHVRGALVRTLVGKDLTRAYEFSGHQLIVKSSVPSEHWRVAWEHY